MFGEQGLDNRLVDANRPRLTSVLPTRNNRDATNVR